MLTVLIILVCVGIYDAYTRGEHTEAILAGVTMVMTAPVLFGRFIYKKLN